MLNSEENAYTIFETMNDRGLNLTNSDMLKGFILSKFHDDAKRTAINEQWKRDMHQLLSYGKYYDNAFFTVWMRSQFAETKRQSKAGAGQRRRSAHGFGRYAEKIRLYLQKELESR